MPDLRSKIVVRVEHVSKSIGWRVTYADGSTKLFKDREDLNNNGGQRVLNWLATHGEG